ncbi:unnamed protein product [Caenorhabditis auriculariae]|uniref:Protein containing ALS2cr12 (ALS2CR12) signature n=1 Tax=Caenorhabditis auriculariae TaxID=2777116 RepID=A0A8S1HTI4_9PELO|nr:unnamed protein product [Caenorhabditis auriculariae]
MVSRTFQAEQITEKNKMNAHGSAESYTELPYTSSQQPSAQRSSRDSIRFSSLPRNEGVQQLTLPQQSRSKSMPRHNYQNSETGRRNSFDFLEKIQSKPNERKEIKERKKQKKAEELERQKMELVRAHQEQLYRTAASHREEMMRIEAKDLEERNIRKQREDRTRELEKDRLQRHQLDVQRREKLQQEEFQARQYALDREHEARMANLVKSNREMLARKDEETQRSLQQSNLKYEEESREADERMELEQREHEKRLAEMRRKFDQLQEERQREWSRRQQQANEQLRQLLQLLVQHRWNQMIENRWANRLMFLSGLNRPVVREFRDLRQMFNQVILTANTTTQTSRNLQSLALAVNSVLSVVKNEINTMEIESDRLGECFRQSGALFVQDIQESVSEVVGKCTVLHDLLEKFKVECATGVASTYSLDSSKEAESLLQNTVGKIPTIHSLKAKYQNQNWHYEDDDPSAVIITEIID